MKRKENTVETFLKEIQVSDKKIVIYGCGVIGQAVTPWLIKDWGLENHVLCYLDADRKKHKEGVPIAGRTVPVCSPEYLNEIQADFVLLITGSRYRGLCAELEKRNDLAEISVYLLAEMLERESAEFPGRKVVKETLSPLIPRRIHYCWFGGKPIPDQMKVWMHTWKRFCPDYEIVEWNESNYDVKKYCYMRQAYERKKWAFVSDVARLDLLYQYGGIYLDTDVELIRSLDDLLYQSGFCGVEKWRILNTGGGCGAVAGHPVIGRMLEQRKTQELIREDGSWNSQSSGFYETMPLLEEGFCPNNQVQKVKGMTIYSSDFFHPYDYMSGKCRVTENTYGIHHFWGSWVEGV